MNDSSDPAASADEALRQLYHHWRERRGCRAFPLVSDIDASEFAYAFGRASVVEIVSGEKRFRYRLVASEVTRHLGYEMRARYAEDIPEPELRSYVVELYGRAVATGAPQYEKAERLLDGRLAVRDPGAAARQGGRHDRPAPRLST